jgi:hypothetical protein
MNSKIKSQNIGVTISKKEYQSIADCIRSDQVPANHIAEYFEDKAFYKWYKKKYL